MRRTYFLKTMNLYPKKFQIRPMAVPESAPRLPHNWPEMRAVPMAGRKMLTTVVATLTLIMAPTMLIPMNW